MSPFDISPQDKREKMCIRDSEPTGNLDSKTSAEVLGLIKRTSAEFRQTVVMITHRCV